MQVNNFYSRIKHEIMSNINKMNSATKKSCESIVLFRYREYYTYANTFNTLLANIGELRFRKCCHF